jgi:hypothetical protein
MPIRRFPVAWGDVEPSTGHWNWSKYDRAYRLMRSAGLRPLIVAIGAPCWAGSAASQCVAGSLRGPPSPSHDRDWGDYVRRLAERYPAAVGLEVWNEPNLLPNFEPRPDPVRYTELLKIAYAAVKGVAASVPVISAGLIAGSGSGQYAISDADFLAAMYRAGARGSMDGIGAHPYPLAGGTAKPSYDVAAMRADLARLRATPGRRSGSRRPGSRLPPLRGFPPE